MKEKVHHQGGFQQDTSVFPFWNVNYGDTTTIRLLPRIDEVSNLIWTEKHTVPMAFVDPDDDTKLLNFFAPSMRNYGEVCPVVRAVAELYKLAEAAKDAGDAGEEERIRAVAGKHWVKTLYYYQGFVIDTKLDEKSPPENPVRVFPVSKKLHNKIKADIFGLDDGDEGQFEDLPSGEFTLDDVAALANGDDVDMDLFDGYNLLLKKAKQGEYADWTSSTAWARKKTSLTEDQINALVEYGYQDTSQKVPDCPTTEQQAVYEEMIQVSIDRLLNGGEGYWDAEWEDAGIKKPNSQGAKAIIDSKSSAKPATKKATKKTETVSSDAVSKIKKRGSTKAKVETEAEATVEASTEEAEEVPERRETLKDRLKARKEAAAA